MAANSFPQLLRRSAFVSHDPLITRVYTSNPSSINKHGDWGLKYHVNRAKNAPYIKVRKLDAGRAMGAPWESAEKEARFMDMWGDGSIPWTTGGPKVAQRASLSGTGSLFEMIESSSATVEAMPNVEMMSEAEFNKYISYLRKHRHELAEQLFAGGSRGDQTPADQQTLPHAVFHRIAREDHPASFQVQLAARDLANKSSKRLVSSAHPLHGLAYSTPATAGGAAAVSPDHKGRVLNKAARQGYGFQSRGTDGTNTPWIVAVGGVTATAPTGATRTIDKPRLHQFDYTRANPDVGVDGFNVKAAALAEPPRVVGLGTKSDGGKRWLLRGYSSARRPGPLSTMRFNIDVEQASGDAAPGTREWVARDRQFAAPLASDSEMRLFGSPRAEGGNSGTVRSRSAGKRPFARDPRAGAEQITKLLASIVTRTAGGPGAGGQQ